MTNQENLFTLIISSGSSPSFASTMRALPCRSMSRISVAISRTFCFSKMLACEPVQETIVWVQLSTLDQHNVVKVALYFIGRLQ